MTPTPRDEPTPDEKVREQVRSLLRSPSGQPRDPESAEQLVLALVRVLLADRERQREWAEHFAQLALDAEGNPIDGWEDWWEDFHEGRPCSAARAWSRAREEPDDA